jgi:hypothetical protein
MFFTVALSCRRRVRTRSLRVKTARLFSQQHYDSQSGMRYEISDHIHIHLLESTTTSPSAALSSHLLEVVKQQEDMVESFNVQCGSLESVTTALSRLQTSPFSNKRCTILDAFSSPSSSVQTVSAKLCDAGCTHLILAEDPSADQRSSSGNNSSGSGSNNRSGSGSGSGNNSSGSDVEHSPMAEMDDDDVREVVEAVLWNDVVGTPMSERLGLRAVGSANNDNKEDTSDKEDTVTPPAWRKQVEEALELNVKHFDASIDGRQAPSWQSLVHLFDSHGLKCNLSIK